MRTLLARPILGIESSCDEMAAAVVQEGKLRSQVVAHQEIHKRYGGVVPELAARAHHAQIIPVVTQALSEASLSLEEVGTIAVTQGPGLLGSLLVGISFANGLALGQGIPLLGIHHMHAHLLANFIEAPYPPFPFLGLTISGGHTQLLLVKGAFDLHLLGTTRDDAIGEAFDKSAKLLGMPYPGGQALDACAQQGDPERFSFPIPRVAGYDFSFSGIKTAFRGLLDKGVRRDPHFIATHRNDLCASLQATLVKTLTLKVQEAMAHTGIKNLVLGGGVANNSGIRKELEGLAQREGGALFVPAPIHCTDNGAMIALTGFYALQAESSLHSILEPDPRMPLGS